MKTYCILLLFIFGFQISYSQLAFSEQNVDLGVIPETYEIKGNLIVKNESAAKIFLMRADADKGVKIFTAKKTLLPGDTGLLVISFVPESAGKFKKKINLVASNKATPYEVTVSGNLGKLKTDDKTTCYYFGSHRANPGIVNPGPIVVSETPIMRDNSNRLPDNSPHAFQPPIVKPHKETQSIDPPKDTATPTRSEEFSENNFRPNNIIFLVDVSSSMRDSLKLPLMKKALHTLINAARNIDTITFITYAAKVNVMKEALSGDDKATLHTVVDSLKAKGMTSGNRAILFSQQMAQKHFIVGGNNQVFIASDGEFKFTAEDQHAWKERQGDKKIILTTVAFGSDKKAIKTLKDIASKGGGSFIHIETRSGSDQKLLEEIKQRSRK